MNLRVLLVNPWIHDFAAYDYWMKPLGLLYMAAYLRRNSLEVQLIDCLDSNLQKNLPAAAFKMPMRKPGGHGKFLRETIDKPSALANIHKPYHRYGISPSAFRSLLLASEEPRLILVGSLMSYWYPGVQEVISILKDIFPHVPLVLGGIYATLCPEHAAKMGGDIVLPGPGEMHLPHLLRDILNVPVSYTPDADDPDSLPYPAFDLLIKPDQLPLLTSRGCPFRCPYCASSLLNRSFRRRNPVKVVEEIAAWHYGMGVADFSFYDDAILIEPKEMIIPMVKEMERRKLNLNFHCPNGMHLREITPEIAALLRRGGFRTLRFGLETTNRHKQKELGGKVNNLQFDQAVAYLHEAGYSNREIAVYLLCGLPGQTYEEIRESIIYVQDRGARPILAEYSPIPGTALWNEALRASPYPLQEEPLYQNNSLLPCAHASLTRESYQELKSNTRR